MCLQEEGDSEKVGKGGKCNRKTHWNRLSWRFKIVQEDENSNNI